MDQKHFAFVPRDDIYLFNTGHARKAWLSFGCRWIPELQEYRFLVWAPNARSVAVTGDFTGWIYDLFFAGVPAAASVIDKPKDPPLPPPTK